VYRLAGPGALGAVFTMTVAGQSFDINVPVESVAKSAADLAVGALKPQIPGLIATAVPAAVAELKKQGPSLMKALGPPLANFFTSDFWPNTLEPLVNQEIANRTGSLSTSASHAAILSGGVVLAGLLAFYALK